MSSGRNRQALQLVPVQTILHIVNESSIYGGEIGLDVMSIRTHVPIIEEIPGGVKVKVGSVEHPMLENHYIEWIEIETANKVYRKELKPGDKPEAEFLVTEEIVQAREYCSLHARRAEYRQNRLDDTRDEVDQRRGNAAFLGRSAVLVDLT